MGNEQMELSSLVTPIPVREDTPEEPAPQQQKNEQISQSKNETTRQTNMLQINENPIIPNKISVTPNTQKARPNAPFKINSGAETDFQNSTSNAPTRNTSGTETGISSPPTQPMPVETVKPPIPKPPPLKEETPKPPKKTSVVTGGVVNGKATSLPRPIFPAPALAVGAGGEVNVQVTIDEQGNVTSAKAVSGHPLLRDAAERAARSAKFSPTLLSEQPVKVVGVIIYNFKK